MNMNVNFVIGVLAIAYGLYSYMRIKLSPGEIEKLQELIERNGEKMGHSIYLFGHTILPVVAGLMLLYAYYRAA
jgi:hypothetical protein